jgi:hypothetical protein
MNPGQGVCLFPGVSYPGRLFENNQSLPLGMLTLLHPIGYRGTEIHGVPTEARSDFVG